MACHHDSFKEMHACPSLPPHAFRSVTRAPEPFGPGRRATHRSDRSRQLRPGELLPSERELGDKFNVSRTVVREAVRSLAARGLVRVTSGRGVEVSAFGPGDVAASMRLLVRGHEGLDYGKVNEVRTAVEVQVAGLAAQRATPEHLERLTQLCDDLSAKPRRAGPRDRERARFPVSSRADARIGQ